MTAQEHSLVIAMLTRQAQYIEAILQILKSRGIVETDDPKAFIFSVQKDASANASLLRRCANDYAEAARRLGIQNVPKMP